MTTQSAYRAKVVALVPARVEIKLIDLKSADIVRSVKRRADEAGKSVSAAVFPGGVTPIIRSYGASEVAGLQRLEGLIAAQSAWSDRETERARIATVRGEYETALKNRADAMTAAAAARAQRDVAKEDFLDAYAAVAGAIKELFPRDRARQDVFFDKVRARSTDAGEDEPDEPVEPTPA